MGKKMDTEFQSIDFSQNSGKGPRSGFAKSGVMLQRKQNFSA